MSIGTEDLKGNELTTEAFTLLKEAPDLNFRGNVEGHDLFENPVEVVVCDGFTGNVMLKTMESIAHAIFHWIKNELRKNPIHALGGKLARGGLKKIWQKTNYEEYGGSPLLGVNGVCIIAHGSSSPLAIHNAIRVAAESIEQRINPLIVEAVKKYQK
jgi:glycerol-3-phosphate acyltransferase PlsX